MHSADTGYSWHCHLKLETWTCLSAEALFFELSFWMCRRQRSVYLWSTRPNLQAILVCGVAYGKIDRCLERGSPRTVALPKVWGLHALVADYHSPCSRAEVVGLHFRLGSKPKSTRRLVKMYALFTCTRSIINCFYQGWVQCSWMDSCEAAELGSADEKSFSSSCSRDSESQVVLFGALLVGNASYLRPSSSKLAGADMTCLTTIKTTSNLSR